MKLSVATGRTARQTLRFVLLLWIALASAQAPSYAATNYTITLANPEQHLVEVQIILPEGPAQRELQLPVWNALYQVRDFAKYVNWVRAKDRAGRALAVHALNPSRWQITGAEGGAVVEYQIFVDSPGPFGAQFNSHHAFFNLAQILMYPVEARTWPDGRAFQPGSHGMAYRDAVDVDARGQIRGSARIMTGWWILQLRSETLRNLISTKVAGIIA